MVEVKKIVQDGAMETGTVKPYRLIPPVAAGLHAVSLGVVGIGTILKTKGIGK